MSRDPTGYLHPAYAQSLTEFGLPVKLPRSGAWYLKRKIPGFDEYDGMGCYPFLVCDDWSALAADLQELEVDLVSFAAVPDPFGDHTLSDLETAFPDVLTLFKKHHFADLTMPIESIVTANHVKRAAKARQRVSVEFPARPIDHLDEWFDLFAEFRERLGIRGIRGFSRDSLRRQLEIPGASMSIARRGKEAVSAHIQLVHNDTVYAHLAASNHKARALSADYALYLEELLFFSGRARRINWGGSAGVAADAESDLGIFKRGWATATRPAYFAGRIINRQKFDRIVNALNCGGHSYFPPYRHGEFD